MSTIEETVDELFSLYERFGNEDYIGEPVSQIEHMSQSAQLALSHGADDEVVLAAFFHDIGHFCSRGAEASMAGYGAMRHELIGADYLRAKGFPERIPRLVENHVQAKRYLTYKNPAYFENLSVASKKTLEFQGGVMTPEEAVAFERDPSFEDSILMRRWDEAAKETEVPVIDMNILKEKAVRVLQHAVIFPKASTRMDDESYF